MIHGGQVAALAITSGYIIWYAYLIDRKLEGKRRETWPRLLSIPLVVTLKFIAVILFFMFVKKLVSGVQYAEAEHQRERQRYQAELYAQAMRDQGERY